ncbi:MAG: hypothetical protein ACRCYE_10420 [Sarcina sp.]
MVDKDWGLVATNDWGKEIINFIYNLTEDNFTNIINQELKGLNIKELKIGRYGVCDFVGYLILKFYQKSYSSFKGIESRLKNEFEGIVRDGITGFEISDLLEDIIYVTKCLDIVHWHKITRIIKSKFQTVIEGYDFFKS